MIGLLALLAVVLAPQAVAQSPADRLAAAKLLYASGAYEEALARLADLTGADAPDDAGQVRAMCLLALGRTADARQSLEQVIIRRPMLRLSDRDVSPQLTALFAEARRRALPDAVRTLYARGRASFETGQYAEAVGQLRDVLRLLSDPDLGEEAASLQDYRTLADGFIRLAEVRLAPALPDDPPPPPPSSSTTAVVNPTTTTVLVSPSTPSAGVNPLSPRIYGPDDPGVLAPVDVTRPMPPWYPPTTADQAREHRGVLRIVIDERGYVEAAALVTSVHDAYDPALLAATKYWKFRPAVREGRAVKFAKLIEVILAAR
jgi:tetratricopeptide (TPR) repeat protein